jgi:hypothetical protein
MRSRCSLGTPKGDQAQGHGGVGLTWEHEAHLHLSRAASSRLLLGEAGAGPPGKETAKA